MFDLWHHVAFFQAEVENLCLLLLLLLHLITIVTAKETTPKNKSALVLQNVFMKCLVVYKSHYSAAVRSSPYDLVFFAAVSSSVFAVVVVLQKQRGLLLVAPL